MSTPTATAPVPFNEDNIVTEGSRLIIPTGLSCKNAAKILLDHDAAQNSATQPIYEVYGIPQVILSCIPAAAKAVSGMFLPINGQCKTIQVRTGPGPSDYTEGPYGKFRIPSLSTSEKVPTPFISTSLLMGTDPSKVGIVFSGEICTKDKVIFRRFVEAVREQVKLSTIFRGKAIQWDLRPFRDPNHEYNLYTDQPTFIDVSDADPSLVHFPADTQDAIDLRLFYLIRHTDQCIADKIPLKSGILLHGPYGCGKSLLALLTALYCTQNNWTFLQLAAVDDLPVALKLASVFIPKTSSTPSETRGLVIFCEDLDQAMGTQDRTEAVNDILNTIDGIDYKHLPILCVFTTNHAEKINKAMLRPGRIDSSIALGPPDGPTAFAIIRSYLSHLIDPSYTTPEPDLVALIANLIPASLRSIAELAKRHMRRRSASLISHEDLIAAAHAARNHLKLMEAPIVKDPNDPRTLVSLGASILGSAIGTPIAEALSAHASPLPTTQPVRPSLPVSPH